MQGKTNYLLPSGAGDISDVVEMLSRSLSNDIIIQVPAPPIIGNIWEDSEGNWTDDASKRVKTVPHSFIQMRYANSVEDFQLIYQRERKKQPGGDEPTFIQWLIRRLKKGVEEHLTLRKEDTQVLDYLSVSNQMIHWLEQKLNIEPSHDPEIVNEKEAEAGPQLSYKEIALIHAYLFEKGEGNRITETNAASIAAQYGWTAKTSYDQLLREVPYADPAERLIPDETAQKNHWKLKYIGQVADWLHKNNFPGAAQKAVDEYALFQPKLKKTKK